MKMKIFIAFASLMFVASCCHTGGKAAKEKLDWYECDPKDIVFDDGDSFACGKDDIRVLGVDTPEIIHEQHGIFEDQPMGREAAAFTSGLLKKAKRIAVIRGGKDHYGRSLAHVLIDGELLGVLLIRQGLAYETISTYGSSGFPEFALQIKEASVAMPRPQFEEPHRWRKEHQRK